MHIRGVVRNNCCKNFLPNSLDKRKTSARVKCLFQPVSLQNYKSQTLLRVFCWEFCTELKHSLRHTRKYLKLALIICYCCRWSALQAKTNNSLKIDVFEGTNFHEFLQNLEN